mmetsp:Transcript_17433/g.19577  ORF Transcript_17433/g.19577 Transcript_17433/m.19577 type:complete len:82 (-) Transcript_17433:61-306(-)
MSSSGGGMMGGMPGMGGQQQQPSNANGSVNGNEQENYQRIGNNPANNNGPNVNNVRDVPSAANPNFQAFHGQGVRLGGAPT